MSTIAPNRPEGKGPVWGAAVASFLPGPVRPRAQSWMHHLPLALILLAQAAASLRLSNTAHRDEGLYIWTGHRIFEHWFNGATLYDNPETYFSGAPFFYPVIAAVLDQVGGLELVRVFSLLWMLAATVALHAVAKRLFHAKAGFWTAASFAVAGPTMFLGHFSTFDAMALSLLALAMAAGVRAVQKRQYSWLPLVAGLLSLAVISKYAALMFVPFVLAVIWLTPGRRWTSIRFATAAGLLTAALLAVIGLTVGRPALEGLITTTTDRETVSNSSYLDIATLTAASIWPYLVIGLVAACYVALKLRRPLLAVVLFGAMLAPAVYQGYIMESVSLEKHLGFGVVFIALAIGALLSAPTIHPVKRLLSVVVIGVMAISGLAASQHQYEGWSNTDELGDVMAYSWEATPYMRTLGDVNEPLRYRFREDTEYWQWGTTNSIYYDGMRGMEAAEAGLRDRYWQYVFLDGTTQESRQLMPMMESFGYKLTNTVGLENHYGPNVYQIWENYEAPRGAAAEEG